MHADHLAADVDAVLGDAQQLARPRARTDVEGKERPVAVVAHRREQIVERGVGQPPRAGPWHLLPKLCPPIMEKGTHGVVVGMAPALSPRYRALCLSLPGCIAGVEAGEHSEVVVDRGGGVAKARP